MNKANIQALIHGLNRHYYSLNIDYHKTPAETKMLLNLHKEQWQSGLKMQDYQEKETENLEATKRMVAVAQQYSKRIEEEKELSEEELKTRYVGKQDPKKHLAKTAENTLEENTVSVLTAGVNSIAIK